MTRPALFIQIDAQWKLVVDYGRAEGGVVPNVPMAAVRSDGHVEYFDVSLWPVGWRILRLGLTIPRGVRRVALRIAAEGTGRGAIEESAA